MTHAEASAEEPPKSWVSLGCGEWRGEENDATHTRDEDDKNKIWVPLSPIVMGIREVDIKAKSKLWDHVLQLHQRQSLPMHSRGPLPNR